MRRNRSMCRGVLLTLVAVLAMSAITATAAWASGKPFVETKPATNVSVYEAQLNGIVNPNGAETKYHFEWGYTTSYGKNTAEKSAGSGTSNVEEHNWIGVEGGGATYHFRIVATNSNGTTYGADQEFSTPGPSPCNTKPKTKKYELCVEGVPTASASTELQKKAGSTNEVLNLDIGPISCTNVQSTGEITGSVSVKENLIFSGCKLGGALGAHCKVEETIAFNPTTGTFGASAEDISVKPTVGTSFFGIALKVISECPPTDIGEHKLEGKFECKLSQPEVEKVQHVEVCEGEKKTTGLEFFGASATLRYEANIALTGTNKEHKFGIFEH